ncbi:MAG TPA: FMN-binding protein [Candidatus Hydrogenedentes bacterium]|nr:FMN-binding protein [Candidatus Hydrogenedentota bacterium]
MTTTSENACALPAREQPSSLAMVRTLGGIALISGCLLSLVYQITYAPIQRNTEARIQAAVLDLLPGATTQRAFEIPVPGEGGAGMSSVIYAGYDAAGNLVGVAIEAGDGGGYGGEIRIMYGYLPDKSQISGMTVLLMRETPGLGDRIRTDPGFNARITGLEVSLNAAKDALTHPITFIKSGEETGPGEIDGISGATISSQAVVRAIRRSTDILLPLVHKHLDALKKGTL